MTRDQKIYRATYWIASWIIGLILLSGCHKVFYPADFALAVYRYHLLPDILVNAVSLYFPWLETICGACLLFVPRFRRAALWIALVLLIGFTGGIIINLFRGPTFGCGCFSTSPLAQPMSWLGVARNTGLVLLVALSLIARQHAGSTSKGDECRQ